MIEVVHELFRAPDDADLAERTRAMIQADPRAIFRVGLLVATHGAWPPTQVTSACRENVALLGELPPETVVAEFEACLLERDVEEGLQWLYDIGATGMFMPEVDATRDLQQEAGRRHKDVWEHTKLVVKQSVKRPAVRWAALLHDIGKVPTRTFTQKGVHFHGHAEVGARMFDRMGRRLPFEPAMRRKVRFLIKHHLRSNQYSATWSDSAVRRFSRDMDAHLTDLLDLSRADITSKRPGRRKALLRQISSLAERVETLRAEDAVEPLLRKGIGTAIMEHFALPPSKLIGDLKKAIEDAIERGDLDARREDAYYLTWLAESGRLDTAPQT